jgi:hypothetical protein
MSNRNVPFLLNASPVEPNSLPDRILWTVAKHFRKKRFSDLARVLTGVDTIIDFGGTPAIWLSMGYPKVVLLNIDEQQVPPGFVSIKGDGRRTDFANQAFDFAFSNSTIEHVGTWEDQQAFAKELCRVGRQVYCQTPARAFFFEPHYFTPFVHWFPSLLRHYWFVRHFTYYGIRWKPSREQVRDFQFHLRLINYDEMKELFPNCRIHRERFIGMTKSYVAIRECEPPAVSSRLQKN